MNIDKLKEVIQHFNPGIMELQQGCELTVDGKLRLVFGWMFSESEWLLSDGQLYSDDELKHRKNVIVFGRPITLEDVLIALQKGQAQVLGYDAYEHFIIKVRDTDDTTFSIYWELGKTLDEQNDIYKARLHRALAPAIARMDKGDAKS